MSSTSENREQDQNHQHSTDQRVSRAEKFRFGGLLQQEDLGDGICFSNRSGYNNRAGYCMIFLSLSLVPCRAGED